MIFLMYMSRLFSPLGSIQSQIQRCKVSRSPSNCTKYINLWWKGLEIHDVKVELWLLCGLLCAHYASLLSCYQCGSKIQLLVLLLHSMSGEFINFCFSQFLVFLIVHSVLHISTREFLKINVHMYTHQYFRANLTQYIHFLCNLD